MTGRNLARAILIAAVAVAGEAAGAGPFEQYLAGIEVLRAARNIDDETRAAYYARLCTITGIAAPDALARIEQFYGRPEQWNKVHTAVVSLLEEPPESEKE
ncbi:MAG: hypothetical protein GF418_00870 [Chitinivibrionales bacterium]|nr:hypothetical protein [Chitinivibrionales bacterium]MBD3394153.1 hypothetical protein [Chitinivibrionales bacterium]